MDIATEVERRGDALAILGLGSVGVETDRLDEFSDLDFYAIVRAGRKQKYLEDLSWMTSTQPIAWSFQNSPDGYKVLYEDGIFSEMAVFEPREMNGVAYEEGRFIWRSEDCDDRFRVPSTAPHLSKRSIEWNVGELVTNVYVGLSRFRRGEKISAFRFVQVYAVDRAIELLPYLHAPQPASVDLFSPERRVEQRFPTAAHVFPGFMLGLERTPEAALALVRWADDAFDVHPSMRRLIEALALAS